MTARAPTSRLATGALWLAVALWTIPSAGLLVNSFRPPAEQSTTGWWTIVGDPALTLDAYARALTEAHGGTPPLGDLLANSLSIAIPATLLPIGIAAIAGYAFAWMRFPGRRCLALVAVALMAVPLEASLVPLLSLFGRMGILGDHLALWLAHTAFGLPLAIFILRVAMAAIPRDLIDAARADGADHLAILVRIALPLTRPALASFAVLQFLWVWNDYLVAVVLVQIYDPGNAPMTVGLLNMVTSKGRNAEYLPAAAFVSLAVPLLVFVAFQRAFVRGLLAGAVKG